MDIEIEREVHKLTLEAIVLGRLMAEEWLGGSLIPKGSTKSVILENPPLPSGTQRARECRQGSDRTHGGANPQKP